MVNCLARIAFLMVVCLVLACMIRKTFTIMADFVTCVAIL